MASPVVLFVDDALARACRRDVAAAGARTAVVAARRLPPLRAAAWERSLSELPLCRWLILATAAAAETVLESAGAPPGPLIRVAAVDGATAAWLEAARPPDLEHPGLRGLVEHLRPHLGRRQRVLVPHVEGGARRIGDWLTRAGAEPVCVAAYRYETTLLDPRDRQASVAAIVAASADAVEILWQALDTDCPGAADDVPVATLGPAAEDAARDRGLRTIRPVGPDLGAFFAEVLPDPAHPIES